VAPAEQKLVLKTLGAQVRRVRLSRGLRQEDLAVALDLSVAYVSLIERGRRNPPITTVMALAQALRASPAELLRRDETPGETAPPPAEA
jgi:transcriptional regulator with XRE-family HTH domain